MKRQGTALAGIIFLLFYSNLQAGNYSDVYGAHARANGMGNAVSSFVDDSSAVNYNVAGLGRVSRGELLKAIIETKTASPNPEPAPEGASEPSPETGATPVETDAGIVENFKSDFKNFHKGAFTFVPSLRPTKPLHELHFMANYAKPRMTTSAPYNQDLAKTADDYASISLAINLNSIYNIKRNIRFGLSIQAPLSGNLMVINDLNPTVHRYLQYGMTNQKPTIMGGLGIELWKDRLFAGVGFNALAKGSGAMLLKDVPISPDTVTPDQQAVIEIKPLVTPTYGLQFSYGKLNLGVAYRREVAMAVDRLSARAQTTILSIQLDMDVALLQFFSPRMWTYGIAYKASDRLLLSFDLNRELWSGYRLSRAKSTYSETLYLNDTTNYRAGVEYGLLKSLKLRMGYTKRPTPVPDSPGRNNWMDFDRLIATGGLSYFLFPSESGILSNLVNPVVFDLVVEYQKMHGRHVYKYEATDKNPNYSSGGNAWHFGASVSMFY
ncbi:MAG: outer membrane protein transport protein [Leptospiraceae bacterium]|nr:outer membrane protein transport protein [Leptospiraceae bacterium]